MSKINMDYLLLSFTRGWYMYALIIGILSVILLMILNDSYRNKYTILKLYIVIFAYLFLTYANYKYYQNLEIYNKAVEYESKSDYINAMNTYLQIASFGDVIDRIDNIQTEYIYQLACQYEDNYNYRMAALRFGEIINFNDSKEHYEYCLMQYLMDEGFVVEKKEDIE